MLLSMPNLFDRVLNFFKNLENKPNIYHGSKVQELKVPFSSPDCIWYAYLREKRQFHQAQSKI